MERMYLQMKMPFGMIKLRLQTTVYLIAIMPTVIAVQSLTSIQSFITVSFTYRWVWTKKG